MDSAAPKAPLDCSQRKEVRQKSIVLIETSASILKVKITWKLLCSHIVF